MANTWIPQSTGVLQIDIVAGTLVDISGQIQSARLGYTLNSGTFYTLGSQAANAVHGKATWTLDVTGFNTVGIAETEAYGIFVAWAAQATKTARSIQLDSPTTASGNFRYTGETVLASVDPIVVIDAASNQPSTFTARLLGSGTLTVAAISP